VTALRRFPLAVWEFVAGDDWRVALGVVLALVLTALVAALGSSAWWVMVLAVAFLIAFSAHRSLPPR
jgi:hypothetical protein